MWILHLLPEAFIETAVFMIVALGILAVIGGFLSKLLPIISQYANFIHIIGVCLVSVGHYFLGAINIEKEWKIKIAQLEARVARAEAESGKTNVEVQEKIVTRINVVREKGNDIIKYIDNEIVKKEEIIKYIEHCPVPKDIIDAHNDAAMLKGEKK